MHLPLQLFFALILVFLGSEGFAKTWYVDSDSPSGGNGKSWADAVDTIHQAIKQAKKGDEIWVKAGTYALSEPIVVNKDVRIYGGFTGIESERRQRNWTNHVTTIDGQDAVYHCLVINTDAVIDGFTITGGNANGETHESVGGGLFIYDASPIINNCTITKNQAEFGGGLFIDSASPTLSHCTISKNTVTRTGGGFYNRDSSPLLRDCKVLSNSAKWAGGIYKLGSSGAINRCVIAGNIATDGGGGIYSRESGFSIISSVIRNNKAKWGSSIYNHRSKHNLFNCTLFGNAAENGGAIRNKESAHSILKNCILWNNTASGGPQILNDETSKATVTYSDVQGGHPGAGNINVNPHFVAPWRGDLRLKAISPAVEAGTEDVPGFVRTDIEGQPRTIDGNNDTVARIDMGADEYHPEFSYKPYGDVAPLGNRDGEVTVGDAVVALRFSLGLENPNAEDRNRSDVAPLDVNGRPNPDGRLTRDDAVALLKKAIGLASWQAFPTIDPWSLYTKQVGESTENLIGYVSFSQTGKNLTLVFTSENTDARGRGSYIGTKVSFSWEVEGVKSSFNGTVSGDVMSGTWNDTSGLSGSWRAEKGFPIGESRFTFPETGDVVMVIEAEDGSEKTTYFGTETPQGPDLPMVGMRFDTSEGVFDVSLDKAGRPAAVSMDKLQLDYSYNIDGTFNYEFREDGKTIYHGDQFPYYQANVRIISISSNTAFSGLSATRGEILLPSMESRSVELIARAESVAYFPLSSSRNDNEKIDTEGTIREVEILAIIEAYSERYLIERWGETKADKNEKRAFYDKLEQNNRLRGMILLVSVLHSASKQLKEKKEEIEKGSLLEREKAEILNKAVDKNFALEARYLDLLVGAVMNEEFDKWEEANCEKKTYYRDYDGDGFGNPARGIRSCYPSAGYVENNRDCRDRDYWINPNAIEICGDGIDQDCKEGDLACPMTTCNSSADCGGGAQCCAGFCIHHSSKCCGSWWCGPSASCCPGGWCCRAGYHCCSVGGGCCKLGHVCCPEGCCAP